MIQVRFGVYDELHEKVKQLARQCGVSASALYPLLAEYALDPLWNVHISNWIESDVVRMRGSATRSELKGPPLKEEA